MFLRTLREDPADADVVSDKLLQRACYLRKAAPGIWTWLPLGLNVLNKIENIIREEGAESEIVFANRPETAAALAENILCCDIHTRERSRRRLLCLLYTSDAADD